MSRWEDLVAERRATWCENQGYGFDMNLADCESPIEKVFLAACLASWFSEMHRREDLWRAIAMLEKAGLDPTGKAGEERWNVFSTAIEDDRLVLVVQPTLILEERTMRPDFAIVTAPEFSGGCRVSIELDGHDFHERTPEQAERDKSKDRLLQSHGWLALRFTGREVIRNPDACVEQAMAPGRARIMASLVAK